MGKDVGVSLIGCTEPFVCRNQQNSGVDDMDWKVRVKELVTFDDVCRGHMYVKDEDKFVILDWIQSFCGTGNPYRINVEKDGSEYFGVYPIQLDKTGRVDLIHAHYIEEMDRTEFISVSDSIAFLKRIQKEIKSYSYTKEEEKDLGHKVREHITLINETIRFDAYLTPREIEVLRNVKEDLTILLRD